MSGEFCTFADDPANAVNVTRLNIFDHYSRDRLILEELDAFGWDRHRRTIHSLRPHTHPRAFEICLIVKGKVEWWCQHEINVVGKGDVYVTPPGETHGGVDAMMHPCELYFLQIRFGRRGGLPGLEPRDSARLAAGFHAIRRRCFAGSPSLASYFRQIHAQHRRPGPHARVVARAALHSLLAGVLEDAAAAYGSPGSGTTFVNDSRLINAIQWMTDHADESYRVRDVADAVGLGVSRFHSMFTKQMGLTPGDYRARKRVAQATQMLRDTERGVTNIAFDVGFSSSQYFATVFKKLTGLTPREYRARSRVHFD
jgi:AraC-like DNA-binding protein/mannose-6-phosphate isomerase-like protein (cupin superfamily)